MQLDPAGVKSLYVKAAFCKVDVNKVVNVCIDKQITVKGEEAKTLHDFFKMPTAI
jgi:hypothetical protein